MIRANRASWKIWIWAKIRTALTNQELALVVMWLRRSERRESETTIDKIIIAGHPELYDTSSYFYRNRNKRILLERKWVNMILLWSKALCIKCSSIWKHVMEITEPALLTRCAWQSHDLSCSPNFCLFVDHKVQSRWGKLGCRLYSKRRHYRYCLQWQKPLPWREFASVVKWISRANEASKLKMFERPTTRE